MVWSCFRIYEIYESSDARGAAETINSTRSSISHPKHDLEENRSRKPAEVSYEPVDEKRNTKYTRKIVILTDI